MNTIIVNDIVREYLDSEKQDIVIVCVGSDKCIYDSLGPIVGTEISKENNVIIYGTLENPVHALNLASTVQSINFFHKDAFIIGIDTCLTDFEDNVGDILFREYSLRPGRGVNKDLPHVGDVSVIGITKNVLSMKHQDVSLFFVMNMAKEISDIILSALEQIEFERAICDVNLEDSKILQEYGSINYDEECYEYI